VCCNTPHSDVYDDACVALAQANEWPADWEGEKMKAALLKIVEDNSALLSDAPKAVADKEAGDKE